MNRRIWVAAAVIASAALLAALAARSDGNGGASRVVPAGELLGAKANAAFLAGRSESGEAGVASAAAMDYENRAYPEGAVDIIQTLAAIDAGKGVRRHGSTSPKKWEQVGDGTMNVDTLGTQSFMRPTQWSGRITAIQVDYKHCDATECKLYIGAAGGGVWMTQDALAATPHWKEMNDGLDSLSIGSLLIDPTDASGKTLYVGTGEPNGSSENEAGLGLYKSTNGAKSWELVPGSVAAAKNRASARSRSTRQTPVISTSAPTSRAMARRRHSAGASRLRTPHRSDSMSRQTAGRRSRWRSRARATSSTRIRQMDRTSSRAGSRTSSGIRTLRAAST